MSELVLRAARINHIKKYQTQFKASLINNLSKSKLNSPVCLSPEREEPERQISEVEVEVELPPNDNPVDEEISF